MPVVDNDAIETHELPGIRHKTVAGHGQGVKTMEVWVQTMAPGAATPVHRHACEEVIVVLSGSGTCTVGGETCTPELDPHHRAGRRAHQLVNTSDEEMRLVATLGMAPVRVKTADGEPIPVPWEAPPRG